ncbi:uncharacterized protein EI97DRAFT_399400 [Westerdykella ornata]|uniref:MFS general substrate transporter n=1 Tax=Westerdykella ornata TaxID=318751 RepID=A0A6A6JHL4_WESOR|nr:uncharacterized protein EI97DRAFT_399400 [Westerdykella ornata]KAF2275877.1 hypothetical protein EI97DRAFT_399400 [Westerdykella ornata]
MSRGTPSPLHLRQPNINIQTLWPILFLLILVNLTTSLYSLPLNRVIEKRLCQEHYAGDSNVTRPGGMIPEELCKIDAVQKRLAWFQGIMETTLVVCDVIVTIPFSFIAERYGVRIVLWCNLVPRITLSVMAIVVGTLDHILPAKTILAGPFLAVFGGECVFSSTIFTLTSALSNDYVQRTSYFSYVSSISYVVAFVGPSLASLTMSQSLWLPFCINIVLLFAAVPTIRLLPDAKHLLVQLPITDIIDGEVDNEETSRPLLRPRSPKPDRYTHAFDTTDKFGILQSTLHATRTIIRLVTARRNFQIILLSAFLTAIASSDTKLLVQYISKRYAWTFAQAGYLLSAKALINILLLTVIVPLLIQRTASSQTLQNKDAVSETEIRMNYLAAEASIAISVIGVLCVGLAFRFWMLLGALLTYALGSALPIFILSLLKSPLTTTNPASPSPSPSQSPSPSNNHSIPILTLVKTLGSLVGVPLMTGLWVQGIRIGGAGLGLPYFVSAVSKFFLLLF